MFPAFAFRNWFGKIKGGVAMVLAGMVPMVLSAQETQWLVDEIGPWSENLYWSNGVPAPETTAIITNGGTATLGDDLFAGHYQTLLLGTGGGQAGTVMLSAGSLNGATARLGQVAGSTGSVVVSGGAWNNGTLFVGDAGTGTLTITGGVVSGGNATLGWAAGSQGTATVWGGTWTQVNLEIGNQGSGTLALHGGQVSSTVATLGVGAGSEGAATVSGGTWDVAIDVFVGLGGTGALTITSGTVSAQQHVYLGLGSGSGTLSLNGGVLATRQVLRGDGSGSVSFQGGTLRALDNQSNFLALSAVLNEGGAKIDSHGFAVGIETALSGAGGLTKLGEGILTLSGTNSYAGGTEVQSGTLAIVNGVVAHSLADTVVGSVPDGTAAFRLEGGSLENRSAFLGAATGATGSATVVSGTWVVGSELVIGEAGTGSLILEGGSVAVSGTTTVGALAGSAGSLTLSGGELATQRVVQGAGDAVITLNGGTLRATADAADFIAGTVTIGSGGAHIDTEVHTVGLNALGGSGGLHKMGTGTLILSGGNTYAGDTHVASGTLVIGSGVSVSHAAGDVVVGGPNATLLLVGGEISSHSGRIGNELGSGGEVRMTGGVWTNGSDLFVGENGSGLLTLEGGTLVSSASGILGAYQDSFGSVTVTSGTLVSATDLDIADTGIGTGALVVQGGRVSNDTARLGDGGTASVSGGTWHNETLLDVGNGRLTISGGGVQSAIGRIGHSGGGGEAQITGGLWESAQLVVGHAGAGTLTVASGGQVWSESAVIGSGFGTDGSVVTVTEDGSQFIIADTLTVGDLGSHNQLVVRQGALVRIGDAPGETIVFSAGGGSDNLLRLDSGYVALFGDQTAYVEDVLLANDFIQVWDGAAWVTATGSPLFSAVYYATEAEAFAATGYGNLGGYTILTSVPEPGTSALVLLSLGTLAFARRRTVRRD